MSPMPRASSFFLLGVAVSASQSQAARKSCSSVFDVELDVLVRAGLERRRAPDAAGDAALRRDVALADVERHAHVGDALAGLQHLVERRVPAGLGVDPLRDAVVGRAHHDELAHAGRVDDVHVLRRVLVVLAALGRLRAVLRRLHHVPLRAAARPRTACGGRASRRACRWCSTRAGAWGRASAALRRRSPWRTPATSDRSSPPRPSRHRRRVRRTRRPSCRSCGAPP